MGDNGYLITNANQVRSSEMKFHVPNQFNSSGVLMETNWFLTAVVVFEQFGSESFYQKSA